MGPRHHGDGPTPRSQRQTSRTTTRHAARQGSPERRSSSRPAPRRRETRDGETRTRPPRAELSLDGGGAAVAAEDGRSLARGKVGAIEGIRVLAILAVVLYHANPSWLPGGYFGVSVFFVLTGYLTTLSVERELDRSGRVDYPRFLLRRLGRLVPSVVALVGVTVVLCALFSQSLLPKIKSDALSALLFFENVHYILSDVPYFAAAGLPSPLTHLWFLGVTMQFYLVWPLVLLLLRRVCPRRRVLLIAVSVLIVAFTLEMALLYDPHGDTSRIYYGPDTRAAELLVGALLALATRGEPWRLALPARGGEGSQEPPAWAYDLAGAAAVTLLVVMACTLDGYSAFTYRGGLLVASLLAAVLVAVVSRDSRGLLARALGVRPLVAAGAVSFSLYLWHYPLLLVMNPATRTVELPWWGWVLEFGVIAAVSVASYFFVEKGVGRPLVLGQTRVRLALFAVCAVSLLVLALAPLDGVQAGVPTGQQAESSQGAPDESAPEVTDERASEGDDEGEGSEAGDDAEETGAPSPEDYTVDAETGVTDAAVLLVGDSVSLGAQQRFYEIFPNGWMDSQISRQFYVGVDVYNSCVAAGHDAPVVIFALGSNGPATEDEVRALIDACGPDKRVLLVNTRVPNAIQDRNNALFVQVAAEYDNVEVVDWYATSTGHGEYFWDDGTHLRPEGADAYVTMLRQAVTGR